MAPLQGKGETMAISRYSAESLYKALLEKKDITVLDVRNKVDFSRFKIESPYPFDLLNISYFDFMEIEEECVAQVPRDKPVKVVCAKEGSAKFVAEILEKHGFSDIGYLQGGIKSWGNLLVPVLINPGQAYQLYQFIRPGKASCSYGLIDGGKLLLFDPTRNHQFYLDFAAKHDCQLVKTCETHLQADYIAGSRKIAELSGAEFLANEDDFKDARIAYTKLVNEQEFYHSPGGVSVTSLFTPGHTPGSTSYIVNDEYMISGDTVFIHSVGRPDLGGKVDAWSDTLFDTLQTIQSLDGNLTVLPGHYMEWSEANESMVFAASLHQTIAYNKAIYAIDNKADFLTFIKKNMRVQPEEYAKIRLINANLEEVDDDQAEILDLGKNECAASAYAAQQAQHDQ
jgi:glyoxylase-like metal-dependent hydrolase (beta-lactamase superfamily II)